MAAGTKTRIAAAFDDAAAAYDTYARVQHRNALALMQLLEEYLEPGLRVERIVDLGCGTGTLSELAARRFPQARITAYDLSSRMLQACRERVAAMNTACVETLNADAEFVRLSRPADLIVSNFCAQWFGDPLASLRRHAAQTRVLAWTTLLEGTFSSWNDALRRRGLPVRTRRFLSCAALDETLAALPGRTMRSVTRETVRFTNARAFLRELTAIGAHTSTDGTPAGYLRPVLRAYETGFHTEYHVATILVVR